MRFQKDSLTRVNFLVVFIIIFWKKKKKKTEYEKIRAMCRKVFAVRFYEDATAEYFSNNFFVGISNSNPYGYLRFPHAEFTIQRNLKQNKKKKH